MPDTPPCSRRSLRTRADIRAAAQALAATRPVADITVDQIADAAHVSRRTFFNHFPNRLAAFVPDLDLTDPVAMERFRAGTVPDLADAVEEVLASRVGHFQTPGGPAVAALGLVRTNPELQPLIRERLQRSEARWRSALAERLAIPADSSQAILLSTLIEAIERAALDYWAAARDRESAQDSGADRTQDHPHDLRAALAAVMADFRALMRGTTETH